MIVPTSPRHRSPAVPAALALLLALLVALSGCAPKALPMPTPGAPRYPDFLFPEVPPSLANPANATDHQRAWLLLQAGDLQAAERGFAGMLRESARFYPAEAGLGYVEIAGQDYKTAVTRFDRALALEPSYVPALVGRGEALLGSDREADALASFEAALAVNPSLEVVRRRVEVLRFRGLQSSVDQARRAATANRTEEARANYERALAASPESAFLHRELALMEQRAGELGAALLHAQRAVDLDGSDARALLIIGEIHEARAAYEAALEAYSRARLLEPGDAVDARIARVREASELARLPADYRAIPANAAVTRGELAALIGVRLSALLQASNPGGAVVITDTRNHWAAPWIMTVAGAGLLEVYANHTFQPNAVVQRGELGQVVSRILALLSARDPALAEKWGDERVQFADVAPGHLSYPAASRAVAAGILPLLEGRTFQLGRPVTGLEAVKAIDQLQSLSAPGRR